MAKNDGTVLVRIRRMGDQWATCGIGLLPPSNMMGDPSMKRRCAKLVPGQVVRLPDDHPTLQNTKLVEIVTGLDDDEFMRPWVFSSAEAAKAADPSLSGMSAEHIAAGLAHTEGATFTQREALRKREDAKRAERLKPAADEDFDLDREEDSSEEELDEEALRPISERERDRRSGNRVRASDALKEDPADEEEEAAPAPSRSTRRRRASRED